MAGFRKAKPQQAALKLGLYGPPGSGKTLTSLLIAEGLAAQTKKRIAYVDTERGTDFYSQSVPERAVHPKAFDFDALYTRSLTDIIAAVKSLKPEDYGVIIIDSITHLWEAAIAAYSGKRTGIGTLPFHAWAQIKRPYKDLMAYLLSSPMHVIIAGRQGNEFDTNEAGETTKVGVKMKAEGETPYEPHILVRMEARRDKDGAFFIVAIPEKDRTGVLTGREFVSPTFASLITPIIGLLGGEQARIETETETASKDAEALAVAEAEAEKRSGELLRQWKAKIDLCTDAASLAALGKDITPDVKKQMSTEHVAELRSHFQDAQEKRK